MLLYRLVKRMRLRIRQRIEKHNKREVEKIQKNFRQMEGSGRGNRGGGGPRHFS